MKPPGQSLLIRADASSAIGSCHIMRCLALSKAWQSTGGSVCCVMAETVPGLEDRLIREGVALKKTRAAGTMNDAEALIAEARRLAAAWLMVDGYGFGPDYIRKLKDAGLRVLLMDDDGRFDFYAADAVLNQNICASAAMYEKREAFTQLLLGSQYVLLRPEFFAESRSREHQAMGRKVLVTMGGSDPDNVTRKVLLALPNIKKKIETKVVVGSGNPRQAELRGLAEELSLEIRIEQSPENMAPLMRWADVAISGAGGTCWELAYLGLPSIVIALSRDQHEIALGLAQGGIAVSLGWHANLSEKQISDALSSLLGDRESREVMSKRGRELVDGQGAARVVTFLRNSL